MRNEAKPRAASLKLTPPEGPGRGKGVFLSVCPARLCFSPFHTTLGHIFISGCGINMARTFVEICLRPAFSMEVKLAPEGANILLFSCLKYRYRHYLNR